MNDYAKQINEIVSYFKKNEKLERDFKIGVEFEHFIIDSDTLRTIDYYETNGVKSILTALLEKGWKGKYEGDNILGLSKAGKNITLEPGAQFEISIDPHIGIKDIEKEYIEFLKDVVPILDNNNQLLVAMGYHPQSKIDEIPFIPKERYKFMSEYLQSRGTMAHNMMKGTCATQVTFDYGSEEDYIKKFKVANILSPVIAMMFDNAPFFEGKVYEGNSIRTAIWNDCDSDRCGVIDSIFKDGFGYNDYGEYILNSPPILVDNGTSVKYTNDNLYRDIFNPDEYTTEELEHVMTMVFPDVRTKKFIEIRMADSIPYPLNFSKVALWKGLIYDDGNLDYLNKIFSNITYDDINTAKQNILNTGLDTKLGDKTVYDIGKKLIEISKKALNEDEKKYLIPLEEIYLEKKTPGLITKEKLHLGKKEAIKWCALNHIIKRPASNSQ